MRNKQLRLIYLSIAKNVGNIIHHTFNRNLIVWLVPEQLSSFLKGSFPKIVLPADWKGKHSYLKATLQSAEFFKRAGVTLLLIENVVLILNRNAQLSDLSLTKFRKKSWRLTTFWADSFDKIFIWPMRGYSVDTEMIKITFHIRKSIKKQSSLLLKNAPFHKYMHLRVLYHYITFSSRICFSDYFLYSDRNVSIIRKVMELAPERLACINKVAILQEL